MSYLASPVATGVTGGAGYLSACRLVDGTLYAIHYDSTNSPASAQGYYSTDEGASWSAESWSQTIGAVGSAGGDDPIALSDKANRVWCAMSRYNGTDSPHAIMRDPFSQTWGAKGQAYSGFHRFTNRTAVTSFDAVMDDGLAYFGAWNIAVVFVQSGSVWYCDLNTIDQNVDSGNSNYVACKIVATQGGTKTVLALDNAGALWSMQKIGAASWSARLAVDTGVLSLEALVIAPNTQPACLYRKTVGAVDRLHFAEFNNATVSWGNARVWDGANDNDFFAGQSLAYDQRGSVHVIGPYDHDGDADANDGHVYYWHHRRALNPLITSWTGADLTPAGVGGTVLDTHALCSDTPTFFGYRPQYMYQGPVFWSYVWASGQTVAQQGIFFVNPDTYSGSDSVYPSIFAVREGEHPYRRGDTNTRSSLSLATELNSSGQAFPSVAPAFDFVESRVFHTNVFVAESGHSIRVAKFPSGRRVFDVEFITDATDKDTIRTFLEARSGGNQSFLFTHPDGSTGEVLVFVVDGETTYAKTSAGSYRTRFRMMEAIS